MDDSAKARPTSETDDDDVKGRRTRDVAVTRGHG